MVFLTESVCLHSLNAIHLLDFFWSGSFLIIFSLFEKKTIPYMETTAPLSMGCKTCLLVFFVTVVKIVLNSLVNFILKNGRHKKYIYSLLNQ